MKRLLSLTTILIGTFLIFSFLVGVSSKASEEEEITKLIETASTAEDHMKIAGYFEKQAEKAERKAHSHASMSKLYKERSKPLEGLAKHCSNLAEKYEESAEEYRAMAMEHRKMAEETNK
ncbi:MAG TPA: hypothetical protein VHT73_14055 [Thermodesulfobacteriota bacterium]|nr:hypothetical protein [Thermodesulfobacteriota bacterium]